MKAAEDVPIRRLVVDSGAFIKRTPLHDLAFEMYTVSDVINEMKCEKTRHLLESLPYEIHIREPTAESLHIMAEVSKKTGDYPSLSTADLKILALAHDFHVEEYGKDGLNYDCVPRNSRSGTSNQQALNAPKHEDKNVQMRNDIAGTERSSSQTENAEGAGDGNADDDDNGDDSSSSSSEGTWLDENNVNEVLGRMGEIAIPAKDMKVACITTDFAVQNVLLCLGLYLLSIDGYRIRRLNTYILRCRACFATTAVMTKRFCPRCGNNSLHRVAVSVGDDGSMQLHVNWKRLQSARGLKYSLPAPKGGKHAIGPQLFEDQPMPQNRMARCRQDPLETGPFAMKDVTSRSAVLGIRSLQKAGQNPNLRKYGKKRGNKRR